MDSKGNGNQEKALQVYAELMIEKIKSVSSDWKKPWITTGYRGRPMNLSGYKYTRFNELFLHMVSEKKGFRMPVFMTFHQAKQQDLMISKGSKSFPVFLSLPIYFDADGNVIPFAKTKEMTEEELSEYRKGYTSKVYNVFNLDQTDFAKKYPEKYEKLDKAFHPVPAQAKDGKFVDPVFDFMIKDGSWICPVVSEKSDRAYFSPLKNEIHLPLWEQFPDGKDYYYTAMHEMAHSTGRPLQRDMSGAFGSAEYGREELIAELTSAVTGHNLGYDVVPRAENAQYMNSWLTAVSDNPNYIKGILSEVHKASRVIDERIELTKEKMQQLDHEREGWTGPERAALHTEESERMNNVMSEMSHRDITVNDIAVLLNAELSGFTAIEQGSKSLLCDIVKGADGAFTASNLRIMDHTTGRESPVLSGNIAGMPKGTVRELLSGKAVLTDEGKTSMSLSHGAAGYSLCSRPVTACCTAANESTL